MVAEEGEGRAFGSEDDAMSGLGHRKEVGMDKGGTGCSRRGESMNAEVREEAAGKERNGFHAAGSAGQEDKAGSRDGGLAE
jgi:hypothetical protein